VPTIPKVSKLRLRFQGQEVVLAEDRMRSVTMGRADDSDVTIKGNLISRLHARIELKRTHYELTDQSTNGTFLSQEGEEEVYLRRDSAILSGRGIIGLGRVADGDSPLAIEYFLED
jgi:adenylate cyclase